MSVRGTLNKLNANRKEIRAQNVSLSTHYYHSFSTRGCGVNLGTEAPEKLITKNKEIVLIVFINIK